MPIDLRLTAERARPPRATAPGWCCTQPGRVGRTAGRARPTRLDELGHGDVHLRDDRRPQGGRRSRSTTGSATRSARRWPSGWTARALAVPDAAGPRRRPVDPAAQRRSIETEVLLHDRYDTAAVLAALSDPAARVTLVSLVPTMLARLLDAGLREPPTLRWALLGGGPIAPALLERAARAGVPVAPELRHDRGLLADRHLRLAAVRHRAERSRRRRGPRARPHGRRRRAGRRRLAAHRRPRAPGRRRGAW